MLRNGEEYLRDVFNSRSQRAAVEVEILMPHYEQVMGPSEMLRRLVDHYDSRTYRDFQDSVFAQIELAHPDDPFVSHNRLFTDSSYSFFWLKGFGPNTPGSEPWVRPKKNDLKEVMQLYNQWRLKIVAFHLGLVVFG